MSASKALEAALPTEKIVQCFQRVDANSDGRINRDELTQVLRKLDSEGMFSESDVTRILDMIDRNKDGYIDYNEFVLWLAGDEKGARALVAAVESLEEPHGKPVPFQSFGAMRLRCPRDKGVTATNTAGTDWGGIGHGIAVGTMALNIDKSYYVCTLDRSRDNDGEGIYIGVAAVDETSWASGTPSGECWALLPSTGQVWYGNGPLLEPVFTSSAATIFDDTCFQAAGADVTVLVDFAKGSLQFSLNSGDFVDSGLALRGNLHAYVHSLFLEDALTLHL